MATEITKNTKILFVYMPIFFVLSVFFVAILIFFTSPTPFLSFALSASSAPAYRRQVLGDSARLALRANAQGRISIFVGSQ
jgi:hypothetical protein